MPGGPLPESEFNTVWELDQIKKKQKADQTKQKLIEG